MARANENRARVRLTKPRPPASLTPAEREVWTHVCKDQTGEWCELAATGSLLERYCHASAYYNVLVALRQQRLAEMGEDADLAGTVKAVGALSDEIAKQSAELLRLERALRLTPQSRVRADAAKNDPPAPWLQFPEDDGDTA